MSRVGDRFAALRHKGETALIPYITAGDPDLATTPLLVRAMEQAGADMIELGLAFSDPLADGPVIQAGSQRALAAGANTDYLFALVQQLREGGVQLPILIMTYYNLLCRPGVQNFCRRAQQAGIDGLILPDVPPEEGGEVISAAADAGLDLVQFVAPTSPPNRIQQAAGLAQGFLYCLSLTGVTGARAELPTRFVDTVRRARSYTDMPIAVGFGVSSADHVRQIAAIADGVIVGSALVRICGLGLPQSELMARIRALVTELKEATRTPERGVKQ